MSGQALRPCRDRSTVPALTSKELFMRGTFARFTRQIRRPSLAVVAISILALPVLPTPSQARGPDGIADIAEQVIDAVVNISTSQNVAARANPMPNVPNDPQLDELFRDFFNRRGQQ